MKTYKARDSTGPDPALLAKPFTAMEAAILLRVHVKVIWAAIRTGELKAGKVGREWRITQKSIEAYLSRKHSKGFWPPRPHKRKGVEK